MQPEHVLHDEHGVLVLAREIIVPDRTISLREVRDVRLEKSGPSSIHWCSFAIMLTMACATGGCGYLGWTAGANLIVILCAAISLALVVVAPCVLTLRNYALILITSNGDVPIAFARSLTALEPLGNAIFLAVGAAGGSRAIPRWGSALQATANQSRHQ